MATSHRSIQDSVTSLPQSNGDVDTTKEFDTPGVNLDTRPFLSYRVTPSGGSVQLLMTLNGTTIVNETFNSTASRCMNEIFDSGLLLENDNELVITRQAGPGSVDVSDLIIVYPSDN